MGGSQQGEGKCLQMMCNNCSLHPLLDSTPTLFFWDFDAIILVFFHVLLKQNADMFAQNACPWWSSTVSSSPHAANHCVFTMYPVWTPRWTQITSIQSLCKNGSDWDHMNAPSAGSDHIKNGLDHQVLCLRSPICAQLWGFLLQLSDIQRPLSVDYSQTMLYWKSGDLH